MTAIAMEIVVKMEHYLWGQRPIMYASIGAGTYPDMSEMDVIAGQAVHICSLRDIRNNSHNYGDNDELKYCKPLFLKWVIIVSKILHGRVRALFSGNLLTLYHSSPSWGWPLVLRLLGTSNAAKNTSRY